MTRLATRVVLLAGVAGLAMAGSAAAATAQINVKATVVRYSTGALATDSGTRALYRALAQAAEQVCPTLNTVFVSEAVVKCRQDALTDAVEKIHSQRLAALHASRNSKSG